MSRVAKALRAVLASVFWFVLYLGVLFAMIGVAATIGLVNTAAIYYLKTVGVLDEGLVFVWEWFTLMAAFGWVVMAVGLVPHLTMYIYNHSIFGWATKDLNFQEGNKVSEGEQ